MNLFGWLKRLFQREPPADLLGPADEESFVYVKLPGNIMPIERGDLYEDPINDLLSKHSLGEVTGGGSQLGDNDADGNPTVEYAGVDLDVSDLAAALPILRDALLSLKAPLGAELHYTIDGKKLLDVLTPEGWRLEQPRQQLHPGFGI